MLSCPVCHESFDQNSHLPVVGVLFDSKSMCLTCFEKKSPKEINGNIINEGFIVDYKVKEVVEKYNEENAPLIELKQQLEEKRRECKILEEKSKVIMEMKMKLLEEITALRGMRKEEDPTCTEWDSCVSCNLFINADKLLNCQICDDSKPICASCIIQYHKHLKNEVKEKKVAPMLDKTIDLDMSIMSICDNGPNLPDSPIYLDADHTENDSIIILE